MKIHATGMGAGAQKSQRSQISAMFQCEAHDPRVIQKWYPSKKTGSKKKPKRKSNTK